MQSSALSPRIRLLHAAALAVLLVFALPVARAQDDPPPQAGRLSSISGSVSIQVAGNDNWGQATPNFPLGPGDRIFTDSDGRAEVQVGQTFLRIGPNADVSFIDAGSWGMAFGVAQGSVHLHTLALWQDQAIHINTPSGSATLSQPGELRIDVLPDQGAAIFTNIGSDATIAAAGGFGQDLANGQALELIGSNPVYPQWLQPAGYDSLDSWSQARDQQIARAFSYRYVSREIPGAEELDGNGVWLPGTDYGAIWFPTSTPAGWSPYHYGHWVNHAPWGWVWVEDEPWGYAPFHYGRWVTVAGRWGWVPGPPANHPIWSPALVVFAGGINVGGAGVSAWFPLGPGEPYRPWYHASPRYIDQINITNMAESPRVHVQPSYANYNYGGAVFANHSIGVTAMRHDDFAAGRPARDTSVVVDIHLFDHFNILIAPEPRPNPQAFVGPPPSRPVPVHAERPVLINETGKLVAARPGAPPVEPPVKATPRPTPPPGHAAAPPPPGATKFQPAKTPPAPAPAAPAPLKPVTPPAPIKPAAPPAPAPVAPPGARPTTPPATKPTTPTPPTKPVAPAPTTPAAPPAPKPTAQPAPKPTAQPVPPAATKPAPPAPAAAKPVEPTVPKPAVAPTPAKPPLPAASDTEKGKKGEKGDKNKEDKKDEPPK